MDLSEPLAGLTARIDAAVLRVLARADTGFSGRELGRLAGVTSASGLQRSITRLVELGLVTAEERPPAIIYRGNREHLLWSSIESGIAARAMLFDRIRSFAEVSTAPATTLVLYGSVARRESTSASDVDLLVIFPDELSDDPRTEFAYQLATQVGSWTGNTAQVFGTDRSGLARMANEDDALLANVRTDGLLVAGPLLRELGRLDRA